MTRRFLQAGLALSLLLLCVSLQGAPRVVTSLGMVSRLPPDSPPTTEWVAVVDPATLSKIDTPILDLPGDLYLGGPVAADLRGHRAYFAVGGGIEVIDTIANGIEALVGQGQYYFIKGLAADPVRARLYGSMDSPPQIVVMDTSTLTFLPPIALPKGLPSGQGISVPVVTADGTRLFVFVANTLVSVNLLDGSIFLAPKVNFTPSGLAVNQDRNDLYVGDSASGGVFVLAADSLATKFSFVSYGVPLSLAVRPSDTAILVETDTGHGPANTRLAAFDPATGATLQVTEGGGGAVVSIDGKQIYRLARGDLTPGGPYAGTSGSLLVLDALTLNKVGSVALDTRAPNDPARQDQAIIGLVAAAAPKVVLAIEYFNAALGHFFLTAFPGEIAALDAGIIAGWQRTGAALPVYAQHGDGPVGIVPVCRFYGLPQKGLNSHFYTASALECVQVQQAFGDSWILESADAFEVYPADVTTGACPFGTIPVYRVFNNRVDVNHRYTLSRAVRDSMVQAGWLAEGYGPDAVAFCVAR